MLKIEGISPETLIAFRVLSRYDLERMFAVGMEGHWSRGAGATRVRILIFRLRPGHDRYRSARLRRALCGYVRARRRREGSLAGRKSVSGRVGRARQVVSTGPIAGSGQPAALGRRSACHRDAPPAWGLDTAALDGVKPSTSRIARARESRSAREMDRRRGAIARRECRPRLSAPRERGSLRRSRRSPRR